MKITVLAENTCVSGNWSCEHGLSLYIEANGKKILFDMGQTELFSENADKMGINLAEVDFAVLSHGHYDHGGGLSRFLEINKKAAIYINHHAFGDYYNGTEKYIGLDKSLEKCRRMVLTHDFFGISEGFTLHSCNDKKKKYDLGAFGLTEKIGEDFVPDRFLHEQYLLIEEEGKRVLISGCSHKGILNIAEWFDVDVIVGGFHFSKLPLDDTLKSYAEILDTGKRFYTCHCTGTAQYEYMKKYMSMLEYISVGDIIGI